MTFGLYLLLNIVVILFFALWVRRIITRRLAPDRILADLGDEIGELLSELNRTGDHNISILEDRIRDLRDLLAAADQQIDDLSTIVAYAREIERTPPPAAGESEPVYNVEFRGTRDADVREDASGSQDWTTSEPVVDSALSVPDQVRELNLQGVSPELIATRTGIAIGEVELIISLGGRKGRR